MHNHLCCCCIRQDVAQDENSNLEVKPEKTDTIEDTNKKTEDHKNSRGTGEMVDKISSAKKEEKEVGPKNKLDPEKHDFVDKELLQVICLVCFYMAKILWSSVASNLSIFILWFGLFTC